MFGMAPVKTTSADMTVLPAMFALAKDTSAVGTSGGDSRLNDTSTDKAARNRVGGVALR